MDCIKADESMVRYEECFAGRIPQHGNNCVVKGVRYCLDCIVPCLSW